MVFVRSMTVVEVKEKKFNRLRNLIVPYIAENLQPYITQLLSDHVVTGDSHNFSWEGMMSLPIRYPPMASYF